MISKPVFIEFVFVCLLAIALAHGGPYGTYDLFGFEQRLLYWGLVILIPWGVAKLVNATLLLFSKDPPSRHIRHLSTLPFIVLIGSSLATVINLEFGLLGEQTFLQAWPTALMVWLIFALFLVLPMLYLGSALVAEHQRLGVKKVYSFLHKKLPDELRDAKLLALKAEDHYVDVITNKGQALIHMSFDTAMATLSGYPGIQIHRSWWLAADQFNNDYSLTGSSPYASLDNGTRAPISRRNKSKVQIFLKEQRKAEA